eukprot:gb/GECH01011640.1/.p1 GENE.gb/GECH01011640.1/~~gb/GECH01011640.1/.p1  ORF type:complete len:221 (+),score=55.63 gb/GECH01011640.1/:1-663(+)
MVKFYKGHFPSNYFTFIVVVVFMSVVLSATPIFSSTSDENESGSSSSSNDTMHLMNHDESHQIINILDDIAKQMRTLLHEEKGNLSDTSDNLKERKEKKLERIEKLEEKISKAKSSKLRESTARDAYVDELEKLEQKMDNVMNTTSVKTKIQEISLIVKVRKMIVGRESQLGELCATTDDCSDYLTCDPDQFHCLKSLGDPCEADSDCIMDLKCQYSVCA